jgi:hypothetical protein
MAHKFVQDVPIVLFYFDFRGIYATILSEESVNHLFAMIYVDRHCRMGHVGAEEAARCASFSMVGMGQKRCE